MKLTNYFQPRTDLQDDIEALSNPDLDPTDKEVIDELVLNLVIKYLAKYLGIEIFDINDFPRELAFRIRQDYGFDNMHRYSDFLVKTQLGRSTEDFFSVQCLSDIRSSAALVKEVILADKFDKSGEFTSVDFGSGTGILLVASLIAARRQRVSEAMVGIGVERQLQAVERSKKLIMGLENINACVLNADAAQPETHQSIGQLPIKMWLSETISDGTPRMRVESNRVDLEDEYRSDIFRHIDPFPQVLAASIAAIPDFYERVERGDISMFPDVINRDFTPDKKRSLIRLRSGEDKLIGLPEVGKQFKGYEDLDLSEVVQGRWQW